MTVAWRKIIEEINDVPSCILAVSGGVDSMFGLDFFRKNYKNEFYVCHFNHRIRSDSCKDAILIDEYLSANGIESAFIGLGGNINNEDEARKQRYEFLYYWKNKLKANKIVTFHHQDDQVETIILNLMRGRPHDKLGMIKNGPEVYRPFLDVPKEKIINQAKRNGLTWNEDSTNLDTSYERNWIRHDLIPDMMARRNVKKSILKGLTR